MNPKTEPLSAVAAMAQLTAERNKYKAALERILDDEVRGGVCGKCGANLRLMQLHSPAKSCGIALEALRGGAGTTGEER